MDMKEKIGRDFSELDLNCAESTMAGACEALGIELAEGELKVMGGFGGGLGCGRLCGALSGSIAALGKLLVTDRAHVTEGLGKACGEYCALFEKEFGGIDCADLRARLIPPGGKCNSIVERNAEMLEEYIRSLRKEG